MLIYFNQKVMQLRMQSGLCCIVDVILPVYKKEPKVSCLSNETRKPRIAPEQGKQAAKFADSYAGTGGWKKLMSCCNGVNTGLYSARNRADVQLVFLCEIICRTNIMEESK